MAPRLSFLVNAHIDLFEEMTKYRAALRRWAKWMKDHYGATNELSWKLRFPTQTAGASLAAQQPEINIARTAIEALTGVLSGTQARIPTPWTRRSRRLANWWRAARCVHSRSLRPKRT